jgi:multisubunit Na+/H+ antiporter MnhE subunit
MRALWLVPVLLFRLFLDLFLSGARVVRVILGGTRGPGGYVRLRFAPMPPLAASILAALVSVTPGSSVVDLDVEHHEMLLHLLEPASAERIVREIRRDYEVPLAALFRTGRE